MIVPSHGHPQSQVAVGSLDSTVLVVDDDKQFRDLARGLLEPAGIEAIQDIKKAASQSKVVTVSGARNSDVYLAASAYLGSDASLDKSKIVSLCALLEVLLDSRA
jgi:CheY-like chemotaxis protein